MRVDDIDLVRGFLGKGAEFEGFVEDLVRTVSRSCGIRPASISWDYRTNKGDEGRDLRIDDANLTVSEHFIPNRPSIWSIKSGDEGISTSALKVEILGNAKKNRDKVKAALQNGWTYVWCTVRPADIQKREAMADEAEAIAGGLGINPNQIEFRWVDHLREATNRYPNIIQVRLPTIAHTLNGVLTIQQWGRLPDMRIGEWVDFEHRNQVAERIAAHLLGTSKPNSIHLAGLSGVGKTRTVFEACARCPELSGVFYLQQYNDVTQALYRYLEEDGRSVQLVVDETSLAQFQLLESRLRDFSDRIRIVSIGPVIRQHAQETDQVIVLAEPDTQAGVLRVIEASAADQLTGDVLTSIAQQSAQDLRLALLLVEASRANPENRRNPVVGIDSIWKRLMDLYKDTVGDTSQFAKYYEVLTASIDVGMAGQFDEELSAIGGHFTYSVEEIRDISTKACECGLGIRTTHFFEATPRALATQIFAIRIWPRIRDTLDDFYGCLPERLAKRFLERCQDCTGPVREEVQTRLGEFFLRSLAGAGLSVVNSRPASRTFQSWAEFDPDRGLQWLRTAVEQSTAEELATNDGGNDGTGGWRGRRQLVWLCQNLASFADHFVSCEEILYRLALHESEPSIGNNSTAIWQSMFWPALASTEVPFDQRLPILLARLKAASSSELPLVLDAAAGCIVHHLVGLPLPPPIVGGRIVPPAWRPDTWSSLIECRRHAGHQILLATGDFEDERQLLAQRAALKNLWAFAELGLLEDVRSSLFQGSLDESVRRALVARLDELRAMLERDDSDKSNPATLASVTNWLVHLTPSDIANKVRDLTSRDYWSVAEGDARAERYERTADELIASPATLRKLGEWLGSSEAKSAGYFAVRLGARDERCVLADTIRDWLRLDMHRHAVGGYLAGLAERSNGLPVEWAAELDAIMNTASEASAYLTTSADWSSRGVDRLLRLFSQHPTMPSHLLRPLGFGAWLYIPNQNQRAQILDALLTTLELNDNQAVEIGIDLARMWAHVSSANVNEELASRLLLLLRQWESSQSRRVGREWRGGLLLVCPYFPRDTAMLILEQITSEHGLAIWRSEDVVEVLAAASTVDAPAVMEEVGKVILDPKRRWVFGIEVFHDLFESIGLEEVQRWLEEHGVENLHWLSRHFSSPYVDDGRPVVPPLTEWLFRKHETVDDAFNSFLMGRHSGMMWSASDVNPQRRREELKPFATHPLRRVREWVAYEIKEEEQEAKYFQELDAEDDRL